MRRVAPHNPMQSRPGQTLKPAGRPGPMYDEQEDTERFLKRGGAVIARLAEESAIVSAVRANEALVKSSALKQQQINRKSEQLQQAYSQRYHAKDEKLERAQKEEEEAFRGGAVSYALFKLDRMYGPSQGQTEPSQHRAYQSPAPRPARSDIQQPTSALRRQQQTYITRQQPAPTNVVTKYICEEPDCRNLARYRNYGLWQCEKHNVWGSLGSR